MKVYDTKEIRNVGIVGHGHVGKTSLVSAMLFDTGATNRLGRVDEGSTVTDYDEEEIARKTTIHSSLAHCDWKGTKINLIDTPGFAAFILDAKAALRACDAAIVLVDAVNGVEVQTEKAWSFASEYEIPRMIVINKLDRERADFTRTVANVNEVFGREAVPLQLPIGSELNFKGVIDLIHMKAYTYENDGNGTPTEGEIPGDLREAAEAAREKIIDIVAESAEDLMEKYFAEGTLSDEDLIPGLKAAVREGRLYPIFAASASLNIGIQPLLTEIVELGPAPDELGPVKGHPSADSDEVIEREVNNLAPVSGYVFKTIADPFAGRITVMKLISGTLKSDVTCYNAVKNTQERLGPLHVLLGKSLEKIPEAKAGDIIAVTKLRETTTGDTFADKAMPIVYDSVSFPTPAISFAIAPKSRNDEDKLSQSIHKMLEEDLTLKFDRDPLTKEFLLAGSGQTHIEVAVNKLKKRYGVEVELHPPKVAYFETFRGRAEIVGRHKKQTGGRGQFAEATCVFEGLPRGGGFEFVDKIFGGAIPQQWRPAVEKGVKDAAAKGAIAGYPMVDFKVELTDGKFHAVDSDDLSFQMAGRKAFRMAVEKVKPVLLEPVMNVEITAPQEASGDILGDINSRRGRVQGMDTRGTQSVVKAQVPLSEMLSYQSTLNSITGARGSYTMELDHYDEVPAQIAQKIIQKAVDEGRVRTHEEE
ncbi:MAG TPA: elongation factor G [Blastocatellia bacterium]|jgi:elongation factor G|nr:elongation factor G [Blastocatellia bacterium]